MYTRIKFCFLWLMIFSSQIVLSQEELPEGPPPAPIDDYQVYLIILGLFVAFFFVRKSLMMNTNLKKSA